VIPSSRAAPNAHSCPLSAACWGRTPGHFTSP
jgi:hypothetical protein